jgi:CheY-like chemotaxis protein
VGSSESGEVMMRNAGKLVVVIDDDPPVLETTASLLRSSGFQVVAAESYSEAMDRLSKLGRREVASTLGVARPTPARKPRVFLMGFPGADQTGSIDDFNSERAYSLMTAHSNTVVGNEALVLDAAARYPALNAYGLNPGLVKSNIRAAILGDRTILQTIMEAFIGLTFPSAETYAARIAPLLVAGELEDRSGVMFNSRGEAIEASRAMKDPAFVTRVIDATEELLTARWGAQKQHPHNGRS